MSSLPNSARLVPLCVDLDGTLVRTDMLHETILILLRQSPWMFFLFPLWLMKGKAEFKRQIAERVEFDATTLPYRREVLGVIENAKRDGRQVILATAAPAKVANRVADHLGLFDSVMSSAGEVNLSSNRKAQALVERFGERGYDYMGNHSHDLAVIRHARDAWLATSNKALIASASAYHSAVQWIPTDEGGIRTWLRAARVHQWVKNALIFVPLVAAQKFSDANLVVSAMLAFVSFSLLASSVYLVNDLLDLASDRRHHSKSRRPFASGRLPVWQGMIAAPLFFVLAWLVAFYVSKPFMAALLAYALVTTLYSFWLKRQVVVDVMLLAGLYTLRVIAGAAAILVEPSFWLLAFAMFVFLSLAMIKRYSELLIAGQDGGQISGRGYVASDLPIVLAMGAGSGLTSVLILALYTHSGTVPGAYPAPQWLWLAPPLMLYWIIRIWMKANRSEVHDDPVLFAVKDWQSIVVFACMALMFICAATGFLAW